MNAYYFRHVPFFVCIVLLLTAPAGAVTVTDFGGNTNASGGIWQWDSGTKTLEIAGSNTNSDYLFQTSGTALADITGAQSVSITGNLLLPDTGAGDFILRLSTNGSPVATASFSFSQFSGGPTTVTSPLTFTGSGDPGYIDQWYILGNGNPSTYLGEINFTNMVVSVPEPSTCVMALAGLGFTGYSMWRRRSKVRLAA